MKNATLAALCLLILAAPASAALRVPQKAVLGGTLQGYLDSKGETINVLADQEDIQLWRPTASGNSAVTLQVEMASGAAANKLGIYNGFNGVKFEVFPGGSSEGAFAVVSFRTGPPTVIINRFTNAGIHESYVSLPGIELTGFGFYVEGDAGTRFTQDIRNPLGEAKALTFRGTGENEGCWWLCFEDDNVADGDADPDFDDAVLFLESVNATPVNKATWASVKARFR